MKHAVDVRRRRLLLGGAGAVATAGSGGLCTAQAQSKYPSRPIRMLTPFAAGGGSDLLARRIGGPMTEVLGQQVIVDNRPGAGGALGAGLAAHAAPDGYTLIVVSGSYGATEATHRLDYDSVDGITPIILIGTTPLVLTMHPGTPVKSVREFIEYSKANPGKVNVASAGVGTLDHLAQEFFKLQTGARYTLVPYKGSGPAMTGLLSNEVSGSMTTLVTSLPHIKAGRLRALGVTSTRRARALPEVPSIGETVPGFEVVHWYGMWGPKGLPKDILALWNREVARILRTSENEKWLQDQGLERAGGPPEEFAERLRIDVNRWKKVVKEARLSFTY
ncbi:MAG: tripartite tricarboxylate transporter substrate binding protein [Burkholderiales bacterium]|nr:tripartite tricarboxylate transporter substrate binding protein [Burkholderiales bacterium]